MTINLGKVGFYLIGALAVIYNFLVLVVHPAWLDASMGTIATIDTVLGFLGVGSFRVSITEAWKGVDLGPVGSWIEGKKAYLSAIASAIFTLVAAFFGVTADTPWVVFVNAVLQVFGISFGVMAQNRMMVRAKMRPRGFAAAFKRIAMLAGMTLLIASASQAQTWDYFFHPRKAEASHKMALAATAAVPYEWQFHPTFQVNATWIRPSTIGGSADAQFLTAAGPAITLQHTAMLADGSNYADYSVNLVFFVGGGTLEVPVLKPSIALTGGLLNNVVNIGAGYDINKRDDGLSRFFFLVSVGINITNN